MLVLSRKREESIIIGDGIELKVLGIYGDHVSLGFDASRDIPIHRKELIEESVERAGSAPVFGHRAYG